MEGQDKRNTVSTKVIEDLQFDYTPMGVRHDDVFNQP